MEPKEWTTVTEENGVLSRRFTVSENENECGNFSATKKYNWGKLDSLTHLREEPLFRVPGSNYAPLDSNEDTQGLVPAALYSSKGCNPICNFIVAKISLK